MNLLLRLLNRSHFTLISVALFVTPAYALSSDIIVGWIETTNLMEKNVILHSKLDTGADFSSLNAVDPVISEEGKDKYISFDLTNREGDSTTIKKRIVRWTVIKNKVGVIKERPVIIMQVCIGNVSRFIEVNLVDRSNYKYQMLIGRNFLVGNPNLIVNSAVEYTSKPSCNIDNNKPDKTG